jgi:rhodanese-related sulfurtransferase
MALPAVSRWRLPESRPLPRRGLAMIAGAALAAGLVQGARALLGMPDPSDPLTDLDAVERAVFRARPLPEITAETLARRLDAGGRGIVLFDVREVEEYALSHIPGAIHLSPHTPAEEFAGRHGAAIAGAEAVFYCSVGVRSGRMLGRVLGAPIEGRRPYGLFNLRGGIFRWHAKRLPLADAAGAPTDAVHGHDAGWGALLRRIEETRSALVNPGRSAS